MIKDVIIEIVVTLSRPRGKTEFRRLLSPRSPGEPLLFQGEDFKKADLVSAL